MSSESRIRKNRPFDSMRGGSWLVIGPQAFQPSGSRLLYNLIYQSLIVLFYTPCPQIATHPFTTQMTCLRIIGLSANSSVDFPSGTCRARSFQP
jgi:hypothetical protein